MTTSLLLRAMVASAALFCMQSCSSNAPAGDPMFPLTEGRSWKYHSVIAYDDGADSQHEDLEITSRGKEQVGEQVAWRRRSDLGVDYWL
jgi:hypothetical protein